MIEKRLVQWYAADTGVDLDIAEREIALTYVLCVLAEHGLLERLAFKGGTAIRKLILGNQGRFSLDLDFTALGDVNAEDLILDVVGILHDHTHYGLTFTIPSEDYYVAPDSCGADVSYGHDWAANSRFGLQISLRAQPLLPVKPTPLRHERYFDWLGVEPPPIPALDLHEILGEKIRAAAQRSRVRDLFDLYQLANQRFDRSLVRNIAVIKCWETRFAFNPMNFWQGLESNRYDWGDLSRLIRRGKDLSPQMILSGVQKGYSFLNDLSDEESILSSDPYRRETRLYEKLIENMRQV
jgi:predicted nucleotidyltransferase component of viral defense system